MTVKSPIFEPFLEWSEDATDVPITESLKIQILPNIESLFHARRQQFAAFIASESMLVVWDDDVTKLFDRAKSIEEKLLQFVSSGQVNDFNEKANDIVSITEIDEELGLMERVTERPVLILDAFYVGCSICVLICLQGLGYAHIAEEVFVLKRWTSLLLVLMTPITFFMSMVSILYHHVEQNTDLVSSLWGMLSLAALLNFLVQCNTLGEIRETSLPYHQSAPMLMNPQGTSRTLLFRCQYTKRV